MEDLDLEAEIADANEKLEELREEIGKGLVGQEEVVDTVLKGMLAAGHVLLEGVPGLAKTLLVRLMAEIVTEASFHRIQFTPDLLPTDITGSTMYNKETGEFNVRKGPIFSNFLLADEINRTTPKVQSAMLEAMQEREVTIGKETHELPDPFMVLATQNPLEQAGTYPLSAAQTDRFLFKIFVDYPDTEEEQEIIDQNVEVMSVEEFGTKHIMDVDDILHMQEMVHHLTLTDELKEYILNIVEATRHPDRYGLEAERFIDYGASNRAAMFLAVGGKANAMMAGREFVTPDDVRDVTHPVLRHRIALNYEGKSRDVTTDDIIDDILNTVSVV